MITNGFAFGYSDVATLDVNFPSQSSYIYVSGNAGDIVYENTLRQAQYLPSAQAGMFYPIGALRILSSGVVNGVSRNTTATGLVYCSATKP